MENRRHPRINVKFCVDYRSDHVWQNAQVMNVSRGGMFVVAKKIESPGTTLEVIFDFGKEDTRKIQAKAVVVWNRGEPGAVKEDKVLPPGMGIKFIKIFPRESENFLGELIEKWDKND